MSIVVQLLKPAGWWLIVSGLVLQFALTTLMILGRRRRVILDVKRGVLRKPALTAIRSLRPSGLACPQMAGTRIKSATYQDVLNAPAHEVAELLNGTLYTHPRPRTAHARSATVLGVELGGPFDRGRGGPGGWLLLDEPELHLGLHVIVPDLAGWNGFHKCLMRQRSASPPTGVRSPFTIDGFSRPHCETAHLRSTRGDSRLVR